MTSSAAPADRLHVELDSGDDGGGEPLLRFEFGAATPDPRRVPCAHLAGPATESWYAGEIGESADTCDAAWAHGEHYAFCALSVDETDGDIEAAAANAYQRLLTCVRPSAHPYLLRVWNYFTAINEGEDDHERYRRFCVGRARAVDGMFNDPPPAATAIGTVPIEGTLARVQLIALCARAPGIALENPRQTPAWRYPREYGPVSPGFSRGALLDADTQTPRLLASGTASIVGHISQHAGDTAAQLRESLANLSSLLDQGQQRCSRRFELAGCETLRVYLRQPLDLAIAQAVIAQSELPAGRVLYLRGDVCRRELDVEIEGVFAAR
jgi:chorismate lyase/3-hydroxybenzoate synthase